MTLGTINVFLPSGQINEYFFPIDVPEEYGVFSDLENQFESSYSGNNPMMYKISDLEHKKE